eukprot:c8328_g1_i1.p1 GENE.c8328_g1_i1~~c8328_g1_i1.p1  ORF type:complete len:125 (-),score=23.59 c8328_g1_i1:123-497(-)
MSLFSRVTAILVRALNLSRCVGADSSGNKFYIKMIDGKERRFIKYFSSPPDPTTVPTEWKAWVYALRPAPPTPEEIRAATIEREKAEARALAITNDENKFRGQLVGSRAEHSRYTLPSSDPTRR